MALFRLPSSGPAALAPRGNGLLLRTPQMADFLQWAHLREYSREYLTPWEPIWPSDDLTRSGFRRRLRRYAEDVAADRSYPFIIFRESDGAMIGGITLANVRRGIVQAGTIGYWVGQPHAHRGYMTAALRVLLPTLFGELNLHRVEAACIPSNIASIRVLEKCGFSREGLARRYLCINGVWQDHLLFGLLIVWVYAAIRPRLGPGPGTAVKATLVVFGASALNMATFAPWMMFLLGKHAMFGHDPPMYWRSMTATRCPCPANVQAAMVDPVPPPRITRSNSSGCLF